MMASHHHHPNQQQQQQSQNDPNTKITPPPSLPSIKHLLHPSSREGSGLAENNLRPLMPQPTGVDAPRAAISPPSPFQLLTQGGAFSSQAGLQGGVLLSQAELKGGVLSPQAGLSPPQLSGIKALSQQQPTPQPGIKALTLAPGVKAPPPPPPPSVPLPHGTPKLPHSQQQPLPSPAPPPAANDLFERKKQEIVGQMLQLLRPFVGSSGTIRADADFDQLGTLMTTVLSSNSPKDTAGVPTTSSSSSSSLPHSMSIFIQRTLLMTIFLSSTQALRDERFSEEAQAAAFLLCNRMIRSSALLQAWHLWLTESARRVLAESGKAGGEVQLVAKILDLLLRLPLTFEQLVEHKYGKIVKKLLPVNLPEIQERAQRLFDAWSKLVGGSTSDPSSVEEGEAGKRRKSAVDQTTKTDQPPAKAARKSLDNLPAVEAASDFFAPPPSRTRGSLILERAALRRTGAESPGLQTRPLSADDIHKAKKRQQFLQEAISTEEDNVIKDAPTPPDQLIEPAPMSWDQQPEDLPLRPNRKRVSFASEADLVQIRYFEASEDEGGLADRKRDYHSIEKAEASYAFQRYHKLEAEEEDEVQPESSLLTPAIAWMGPPQPWPQSKWPSVFGGESRERSLQEDRERRVLGAVYYGPNSIPDTPHDHSEHGRHTMTAAAKRIPIIDAKSVPILRMVPPAMSIDQQQAKQPNTATPIPNDLLGALLSNPSMLQQIISSQGEATNEQPPTIIHHPFFANASIPMMASGGMFIPPPPSSFPLQQPMGTFRPPFSQVPPFPFPPPPPHTNNNNVNLHSTARPAAAGPTRGPHAQQQPKQKYRYACKNYQPGRPGSCRYGDKCSFIHSDG